MDDRIQIKCNLCNADNAEELFIKDSIRIVRCRLCGLVYANFRSSQDEIKRLYNKKYFNGAKEIDFLDEKELYFQRFEEKIKQIEALTPAKGRLLDIGCAVGYFLLVSKRRKWQTFGVEISSFAANKAKEAGVEVFAGTLEEAKYQSGFFDVITLWHIIEHLEDPQATLREVQRILKDNGLLVIETPNFSSRSSQQQGKNWEYIKPHEHLYYFTIETIKTMLERVGFRNVSVATLSSGTGTGRMLAKFGLLNFKKKLIHVFNYLSWIKKSLLRYSKADDLLLVYARK